jgi:hypothetical protein
MLVPVYVALQNSTISWNGTMYHNRKEMNASGPGVQLMNGLSVYVVDNIAQAPAEFHVFYRNMLVSEQTLIHAHGMTPPWTFDGVPVRVCRIRVKMRLADSLPVYPSGENSFYRLRHCILGMNSCTVIRLRNPTVGRIFYTPISMSITDKVYRCPLSFTSRHRQVILRISSQKSRMRKK